MVELTNDSPVGRLLEELSWEGNARKYREGGRGLENVLVTEVFQALDLLPRAAFLAEVVRQAHGDASALDAAAAEAEAFRVDVLPGGSDLCPGGPNIQPDVLLRAPTVTVVVEAKRLRSGSFQPEQLAREYLVLERDHPSSTRILLLVLPDAPPVAVRGRGRLSIRDAILEQLEPVHARAHDAPDLQGLVDRLDAACAWTTWADVDRILEEGRASLPPLPTTVEAAIGRTSGAGRRAIAWHS